MTKFKIQADGTVFNQVEKPAVVFDKSCGTLHKIGEYDIMKQHQQDLYNAFMSHGFNDIAEDIILMELPKDQEIIDKVFNNTGYVKRLYDKTMAQMENNHVNH